MALTLKDVLIKFQEWQLENKPLNANFAHNGVANLFLEKMSVENPIPDVVVAFCPKCKTTHIKPTFGNNWLCWDCGNEFSV